VFFTGKETPSVVVLGLFSHCQSNELQRVPFSAAAVADDDDDDDGSNTCAWFNSEHASFIA